MGKEYPVLTLEIDGELKKVNVDRVKPCHEWQIMPPFQIEQAEEEEIRQVKDDRQVTFADSVPRGGVTDGEQVLIDLDDSGRSLQLEPRREELQVVPESLRVELTRLTLPEGVSTFRIPAEGPPIPYRPEASIQRSPMRGSRRIRDSRSRITNDREPQCSSSARTKFSRYGRKIIPSKRWDQFIGFIDSVVEGLRI
jgi:hypothetical protein